MSEAQTVGDAELSVSSNDRPDAGDVICFPAKVQLVGMSPQNSKEHTVTLILPARSPAIERLEQAITVASRWLGPVLLTGAAAGLVLLLLW